MSDFSQRVFSVVKNIPRGEVWSYGKVAKRCGRPKAARAVGNILNKNQHLVTVPCHRVVRSTGEVGRYVGGEAKKARLLKDEGVSLKKKSGKWRVRR